MFLELLDGPSKTAKTSIGRHLKNVLQSEIKGEVRLAIAGEFFRRMAMLCVEEVGDDPSSEDLQQQLTRVIATEDAFDEGRKWGDLQTELADTMSSRVGSYGEAQEAMGVWYDRTTTRAHADDVELLIIDARNPRLHVEGVVALDLFLDCDIDTAVRRMSPPVGQESQLRRKLIERRRSDEVRPDLPMQGPRFDAVPYTLYTPDYVDEIVASMNHVPNRPAPVYFDNSELALVPMLEAATLLSRAALTAVGCGIMASNV